MVCKVGVSIEGKPRPAFGAMIAMQLQMLTHHVIHQDSRIIVVKELTKFKLKMRSNKMRSNKRRAAADFTFAAESLSPIFLNCHANQRTEADLNAFMRIFLT